MIIDLNRFESIAFVKNKKELDKVLQIYSKEYNPEEHSLIIKFNNKTLTAIKSGNSIKLLKGNMAYFYNDKEMQL